MHVLQSLDQSDRVLQIGVSMLPHTIKKGFVSEAFPGIRTNIDLILSTLDNDFYFGKQKNGYCAVSTITMPISTDRQRVCIRYQNNDIPYLGYVLPVQNEQSKLTDIVTGNGIHAMQKMYNASKFEIFNMGMVVISSLSSKHREIVIVQAAVVQQHERMTQNAVYRDRIRWCTPYEIQCDMSMYDHIDAQISKVLTPIFSYPCSDY